MKHHLILALCLSPFLGFAQLGVGTTNPTSTLDVRGSISGSFKSFTGNLTLTKDDYTVVFTGSTNTTVNLPDASTCLGRMYNIKNNGSGSPQPIITISAISGQTIDGSNIYLLNEPYQAVSVISNGTQWVVGGQNTPSGTSFWSTSGNNLSSIKSLGTTSYFPIKFITDDIERMRITETGKLGLGIDNPISEFHILAGASASGITTSYIKGFTITGNGTYGFSGPGFYLENKDNPVEQKVFKINFTANGGNESYLNFQSVSDDAASSVKSNIMALFHSGKVGIGTDYFNETNPEQFIVNAGWSSSKYIAGFNTFYDGPSAIYTQNKMEGENASSGILVLNEQGTPSTFNVHLGINSSANTETTLIGGANKAFLLANGEDFYVGNGTTDKDLIFFTGGKSTSNAVMKMTATGLQPASDNSFSLGNSSNRWSQLWSANGTIQTSDIRMKTNINLLPYGLKEVLQLNPVSYHWKTDLKTPKIGLIAQEVQKIIPEVVIGDASKDTLGLNYAELVPVLIKAIQEQQATIDQLKKEINTLKKQ